MNTFMRKPVASPAQQRMRHHTFPAPTRGWVVNETLVSPKKGGASVLENMFPMVTGVRIRGGSYRHATVGSGKIASMIAYRSGNTKKLFACQDGEIFDVTSPVDRYIPPAASVTGLTSSYFAYTQFSTAGGDYLLAVNGSDLHRVYDGASWAANVPAITGTTSNNFSHVWVFKNRLFFVKKSTNVACYLPVDSIGGATADFSLAGIFKRGGSLMFGATWSLDAGDGLDDKCVFVSTLGEVVVFEGSNPASASDWAMIGRYDMSSPLGINSTIQAGGDLLIATVEGLIPISAAINKDPAALSLSAVSAPIEPAWKDDAVNRISQPWEVKKWPELNMAIVSAPANTATQDAFCYVVNLFTGAWSKYTAWDVQSMAYHNGFIYFGTSNGRVMQAEVGGFDDGMPYVCSMAGLFETIGGPALKIVHQARSTWSYSQAIIDKVSMSVNYETRWPAAPVAASPGGSAGWDAGVWDSAIWDAGVQKSVKTRWVSVGRSGFTLSPQVQVTCGSTVRPSAELVSIDITYEGGGVVV